MTSNAINRTLHQMLFLEHDIIG